VKNMLVIFKKFPLGFDDVTSWIFDTECHGLPQVVIYQRKFGLYGFGEALIHHPTLFLDGHQSYIYKFGSLHGFHKLPSFFLVDTQRGAFL